MKGGATEFYRCKTYDVSGYQLTLVYTEWGAVPEKDICLEVPLLVVVTDIAEVATRLES